jgi:ElaB/YqjD/DUF883 family membrane-anchored ribosome-binding protein
MMGPDPTTSRIKMNTHIGKNGPIGSSAEQLNEIVIKAEELLKSLGEDGGSAVHELRERVGRTIRSARARIGSLEGQAEDMASSAVTSAQNYAKANPWTVVAMAAAIGLAVGALVARRA